MSTKSYIWWYWYNRYLKSEQWEQKALKVRRRDKFRCRKCGERGWIVHHLTYERVGKEHMRDLITVCDACHKRLHGGPS